MKQVIALLVLTAVCLPAVADSRLDNELGQLEHDWVKANYQTAEDASAAAFKSLAERAHAVTVESANAPEAMIWEAIILSSYAEAKGGLPALKLATRAKDLLLGAEKTDPQALHGYAYITLGTLYYKVPGWPLGFGDKNKARAYLEKALQLAPTDMDANYFYADFLSEQGDYAGAAEHYKKALAAPARAGYGDAEAGRRQDIIAGLQHVQKRVSGAH